MDSAAELLQLRQALARLEEKVEKRSSDKQLRSNHVDLSTIIANPAPLGLFGFGLTTAIFQGAVTGISGEATTSWAVAFGLGYGGLAQFAAGMIDFVRGNIFGGVAFTSYGCFWLSFAFYNILTKATSYSDGTPLLAPSEKGEQMVLGLWAVVTYVFWICTFAISWTLNALFFFLGTLFVLLIFDNEVCHKFAGWWGLVTAAIAMYIAAAEIINSTHQAEVLPLLARRRDRVRNKDLADFLNLPHDKEHEHADKSARNVIVSPV